MKNFITILAFVFIFNVFFGHMSLAQDQAKKDTLANSEAVEPWIVRCNDAADMKLENKRGKCEIFQRLNLKETGQRVVEMAIGFPADKTEARGIFILPLGILLKPGVMMQVDDNKPLKFGVRYCVPNGCIAYVNLNDTVLDMLKKGNAAKIQVKQSNGESITLPIVLNGVTAALAKIK